MQSQNIRIPRSVEILGEHQIQPILKRVASFVPLTFYVLNVEGHIVMSSLSDNAEAKPVPLFVVQNDAQGVSLAENAPEGVVLIAAPILFQGDLDGYLAGLTENDSAENREFRLLIEFLSERIGEKAYSEYELQNLTEELIEKYNEVNLIYDIADTIGAVLNSNTVCNFILEKAVRVIGVDKASVMLYDDHLERLFLAASYGLDLTEEELKQVFVKPGEGVSGKVFVSGKHLLIEDIENDIFPDIPHTERNYKSKSFVSVPMRYKRKSFLSIPMICSPKQSEKRVMGVINMTDKQGSDMFTSGDLRLLTAIASQAAMSLYNIELIEEVKDAERVKREMEIAQQIQTGLLPGDPPSLPGIELAGRCLPATQVGGDYYDFFLSPDNKLGMVIADVSGHNVGAALMMAAARSTLRSEVLTQQSPATILGKTNFILYSDLTNAELFITMFYAEYDANTRVLRYSNGGHNNPILLHDGVCSLLDTEGMLIGMLESVDFEEKALTLQSGDVIIFYTDGVVEAVNDAGEMFKLERLRQVIERYGHYNSHDLLETIYTALQEYSGSALGSDDITVVVLKVH
ncbi:serine phosphatase [Candidatus Moduliflexus flocculans]|uniref:Serine phosphatase n=1 Tax=Candidatus Moduliflexus flocculans TaxID=1499966 RepID=A0A0S6VSV9_9BACT|nr:serine phosphatase [Candidatus Moduliflexus flocculans]